MKSYSTIIHTGFVVEKPHFIGPLSKRTVYELLVFCDASVGGYAAEPLTMRSHWCLSMIECTKKVPSW